MSGRADIRQAVEDWFSPPAVPFINSLYPSMPKLSSAADAFAGVQPGMAKSGGSAYVSIGDNSENRIAFGGPHSGKKKIVHNVTVIVGFWTIQTVLQDGEADHDAMVDGFKTRLRSDRRLGRPDVIFEAGEFGGIRTKHDEFIGTGNGAFFRWTRFEFNVMEILTT